MINLKLLGHIVLDSESQARFGIEGNTFNNTFRYLSTFLEGATGQEAITEDDLASINHLRGMLYQLVEVEDALRVHSIELIARQLIEKVQQLLPEQSLLLPGGWSGNPYGHAMIYEFERDAEGNLLFHIYNSGAGTQYHQKITLADKEAFVPKKTYQLPNAIPPQEFTNLIETLLANKIRQNPKRIAPVINEDSLYNFISSQMIMLNAQEKHLLITPETIQKATTAGQLSGTCSQRSIHQMLKLHFKEPKNYQIFIFKFQMHALQEYLQSPPNRYSPLIAKFLKKALARNTRHLLKLQKQGWIQSQKFDEFKAKILTMSEIIEQKTQPEMIEALELPVPRETRPRILMPYTATHGMPSEKPSPNPPDFPVLDIMTQGQVSLEKLQRTLSEIQDNGQNLTYKLHQLHELIYALPLRVNAYPVNKQASMLIQINKLIDNYQMIYGAQYPDSITPQHITCMLSLLTIYLGILNRFQPQETSQIMPLKNYIQSLLSKIDNNPLKAGFDPKIDKRLSELQILYPYAGPIPSPKPSLINFYREIQDPNLDALAEEFYRTNKQKYALAKTEGLLNIEFIKDQFLPLDAPITFIRLDNFVDIQTRGLRNCFVKIHGKSYWIPAFGEPEEFIPGNSYFSMRYRILKDSSPLLQAKFLNVFLRFQQQLDLETTIYRCLEPAIDSRYKIKKLERNLKLRDTIIDINIERQTIEERGPLQLRNIFYCPKDLVANTYAIHNPKFEPPLFGELLFFANNNFQSKRSNEAQVSHLADKESQTFEQILLYRELTHLRTNLDTCASLSLSYFSEHLEKLSQPDIQNYLEINLFQDVTKVNFEQLEAFIQDALQFHQENGINTQTSIYCICLKAKLYDYINHPNTLNWIETNLALEDKPEFKALLHAQRFKTLMAKKDRTPEEQEKIYDSYLWIKNKYTPRANQTLIEISQLEDAILTYQVQDKGLSPEQMIRLSLSHLGIDAALFEIQPHEQNFILRPQQGQQEPLILDIHKGQLFSTKGVYKPIPKFLSEQPIFKELGLEPSCFAFQNEGGTEFHIMNPPTRFLLDINNNAICQKKIGDSWYTRVPITKDEKIRLCLINETADCHDFPEILKDADCQLWYDTTTREGQLFRKNIKIFDIHSSGELIGLEKTPIDYSQFESQEFIFKKDNTAYLTRYGFSITNGHIDDGRLVIIKSLKLLPENTAQLYCLDEGSGQEFCRVPIHAFYFDKNQTELEGALPTLTHDISNTIITKILEQENKKPIARYENTCEFYQYPIIDGQIQPENAEMALYLCYIHLVNRDYDKANAILKTIGKIGFSGTEKELQFLDWILNKIPYPLPKQKNDAAKNPEEVACQLKALSLYTQFINEGMKPQLGKLISNPNEKQVFFKSIIQKDAQSVYTQLANKVAQKIHDYQTRLRHTPIQFQLTDAELLSMTRYLNSQRPTLDGSLSYLHQSLQLKQIQQQIKHLQSLPQSPKNQEKLEKLQEKLTQHVLVRQRISEFATLEVTNNLTEEQLQKIDSFQASYEFYRQWRHQNLLTIRCNQDTAMHELNSRMGIHALIRNFPAYAQIAYDENNPYYPELREFLTRYIRSQYHTPLEKQPDAFLTWCLFLYRVSDPCSEVQSYKTSHPNELKVSYFFHSTQYAKFEPILATVSKDKFIEESIPALSLIEQASLRPNETLGVGTLGLDEKHLFSRLRDIPEIESIISIINTENQKLNDALERVGSEELAGAELLAYRNKLNQIEFSLEQIDVIEKTCHTLIGNITPELVARWLCVLQEYNLKIQDTQGLELLAELRTSISKEDLLRCYHQNDLAAYRELFKHGVSDEEIRILHNEIHHLMHLEINLQQALRLKKALDKDNAQDITRILSEENLAPDEPSLMVFQYQSDILLRPQQKQALELLMQSGEEAPESIQKVTMGGGKSKVLLPSLAQKKANGERLIIVEVPQALLESNFRDLNQTSQDLFKQKALRFEFNRDSDCTAKRLENIYHLFHDCMIQKDYIVTTGESMASLELKYLELLSFTPEEDEEKIQEWQQQVYWAGQTLNLLRTQGEAIIDEVHQALWLKKQLNYTMGDRQFVDELLIEESLKFYNFYQSLGAKEQLAEQLISNPSSPLEKLVKKYPEYRQHFIEFFNQQNSLEGLALPEDAKTILSIYKTQINLMPKTIEKHYREHYGPSKSKSKNPLERCIAIPYSANEKPSERSEFAQSMETINYTIQSIYLDGLNPDVIEFLLEDFVAQARVEVLQSQGALIHINDSDIGQIINKLLSGTGLTIGELNFKNPEQMQILHHYLKNNPVFIHIALQEKILPLIRAEQAILQSDCYQHVDLYQRVQGFSGTPWNAETFHHRLHFNPNDAIGHDGFIQKRLIEKNTQMKLLPEVITVENILKTNSNPNLRALIDVGAVFKGIDNFSVAQQLKIHTPPDVQYILFYDDKDMLCALSKTDDKIIVIGKTDPTTIREKLACKPSQYFTYYDQAHTIGADIAQFKEAHAICLVDEKTPIQSFLQASMRMRQLMQNQTIDIVVPPSLAGASLEALMAHFSTQQDQSLKDDYIFAAIKQMKNTIRQALIRHILAQPEPLAQKELFENYKTFFIQQPIHNIYQRFGTIEQDQVTQTFLERYQAQLLIDYEKMTGAPANESIRADLEEIQQKFLPLCPETVKHSSFEMGQEVEQEQEMQMEVEQEQEMQKELHLELFDKSIRAKSYEPNIIIKQLPSLNFYMPEEMKIFEPNLRCSPNYIQTYENQSNYLDAYLKPVHSILINIKADGEPEAILISEEDVVEIKHKLGPSQWIVSSNGHVLIRAKLSLNSAQEKQYQKLLEQTRFFGGHLKELINQNEAHQWIDKHPLEYIALFKRYLSPYREYHQRELTQIASMFSEKPKAIQYLFDRIILEDLNTYNWKDEFKNLSRADIRQLKNLVNDLNLRNQNEISISPEKIKILKQQYPLMAEKIIVYLQKLINIDALFDMTKKTHVFDFPPEERLSDWGEFESFIKSIKYIHAHLLETDLDRAQIHLSEQFPFLSTRLNLHFQELARIKTIVSEISRTPIEQLVALTKDSFLPRTILREIIKKTPSYNQDIINKITLFSEDETMQMLLESAPDFKLIDHLMTRNPWQYNHGWLTNLALKTIDLQPLPSLFIQKLIQAGLTFDGELSEKIIEKFDLDILDMIAHYRPENIKSILKSMPTEKKRIFLQHSKNLQLIIQCFVSQDFERLSAIEGFNPQQIMSSLLDKVLSLDSTPKEIQSNLQALGLQSNLLTIKQKIDYFINQPALFQDYIIATNPIDIQFISACLRTGLRPQIWSLLQNEEFLQKPNFETLFENTDIQNILDVLRQFQNHPYAELNTHVLPEREIIQEFKQDMDALLTNIMAKNTTQTQEEMTRKYPFLRQTIAVHFEKIKILATLTQNLLNPEVALTDEREILSQLPEIEIPIEEDKPLIYQKINILKILLDKGIITLENLRSYIDHFSSKEQYPNWFLEEHPKVAKCQFKLLDNYLVAEEYNIARLEAACLRLENQPAKELQEYLIQQHLATIDTLPIDQKLKDGLKKLGQHTIKLLKDDNPKGKKLFSIFLQVKYLVCNQKANQNLQESFEQMMTKHQEIIDKHHGFKKLLQIIFKYLFNTSEKQKQYSLFKPKTKSEQIIESIKENIPKKNN